MKNLLKEFREFINKGNVMDMAVGIIVGSAFTAIVTSLVDDIISPLLGIFGGVNFDSLSVNLGGDVTLNYGKFLMAIFHFLLIAMVVFLLIRMINKGKAKFAKEETKQPVTKECPFCKSEIAIEATRCPHCTSVLTEDTKG